MRRRENAMTQGKYIRTLAEGDPGAKTLLGEKGANLCAMKQLGLNVPAGFVITKEACVEFHKNDGRWPDGLFDEVCRHVVALEQATGKRFGAGDAPLLLSVRSGAASSMPGMLDTVLNVGINRESLAGLARSFANADFAVDTCRRFI